MLVLVALLLSQDPAAPTPQADAKRLFQSGSQAFEARRYEEAAHLFEASFARRHRPESAFNRARCAEFLGDVPGAIGWYRWYLRLSPTARDRADLERTLQALARKAAAAGGQVLTVFATPETASLRVDDGPAAVGWLSVQLPPGPHRVSAAAEGYLEVRIPLELALDTARELPLALELRPPTPPVSDAPVVASPPAPVPVIVPPLPAPAVKAPAPGLAVEAPPRSPTRTLRWTWVAGGLTVASAAVGTGLGFSALSTTDRLRGKGVQDAATVNGVAQDARALAGGADLAWVTAGAALAATVAAYVLER